MDIEEAKEIYDLVTEPWARKAWLLTHKEVPEFTEDQWQEAKEIVENYDFGEP